MGLGQFYAVILCCSHWIYSYNFSEFASKDFFCSHCYTIAEVLPYPPTLAIVPILGILNFLKIIENPSKKQQQPHSSSRNSIAISISNNNNKNNNTNTIVIIITLFAITLVVVAAVVVIECWWLRSDSINKQHQPTFISNVCRRLLLKKVIEI